VSQSPLRWTLLIFVNALLWCVLSFHQTTTAAPKQVRQPFDNAVAQRNALIEQLKESNALLREQNALLRSGKLEVVVVEKKRK